MGLGFPPNWLTEGPLRRNLANANSDIGFFYFGSRHRGAGHYSLIDKKPFVIYLDGVTFVRSVPIVSITRLPRTHSPRVIPAPPYASTQIGVAAFCSTFPSELMSHTATSGPIALLQK